MKYILSLDGGGSRGVIAHTFLQDLEKMLLEEKKVKITDIFDMYVGSSAGGIMALMFGSGKCLTKCGPILTHRNLCEMMNKSLWDKVLPIQTEPKYDGKGMKKTIESAMDDIKLSDCPKPTHVITYQLTTGKPRIFSSTTDNISIRRLALMTSAAPTYFPCIRDDSDDSWFVDGAMAANNPSLIGYTKALKQWPGEEIRILSVGTGYKKLSINGEYASQWGAFRWLASSIVDITIAAPAQLTHSLCKDLLPKGYLRINSPLGDIPDEFDNTKKASYHKYIALGHRWFDHNRDRLREFFDLV